jgi:hypothetical protein
MNILEVREIYKIYTIEDCRIKGLLPKFCHIEQHDH